MEAIWCTERIAPRCPQNSAGGSMSPMYGTTYQALNHACRVMLLKLGA